MTLLEAFLLVAGLSVNVFLAAENEGANLRHLRAGMVALICLIFFIGQVISMGCGYLISRLPFFQRGLSGDVKAMCYVLAALIFLAIGGMMFYRAVRKEFMEERAREIRYRPLIVKAAFIAVITFCTGIGCGFLGSNLLHTFLVVAFVTIAAVVGGLYTGYYQGARFRPAGFGISSALFVAMGVEVLIRYI